jgi:hypothetical protein
MPGSVPRRDADEQSIRDRALAEWARKINGRFGKPHFTDLMTSAYHEGACEPGAAGYPELMETLVSMASYPHVVGDHHFLALAAGLGDPEGLPGLSAPAVLALERYYANALCGVRSRERAEFLLTECFSNPLGFPERDDEAHYERLQKLCESFGTFLTRQSPLAGDEVEEEEEGDEYCELGLYGEGGVCVLAARVLGYAPAATLSGPLTSWVAVFARRIDDGTLDENERELLQEVVAKYVPGTEGALALAAVAQRL